MADIRDAMSCFLVVVHQSRYDWQLLIPIHTEQTIQTRCHLDDLALAMPIDKINCSVREDSTLQHNQNPRTGLSVWQRNCSDGLPVDFRTSRWTIPVCDRPLATPAITQLGNYEWEKKHQLAIKNHGSHSISVNHDN